jgi:hypothetical protein
MNNKINDSIKTVYLPNNNISKKSRIVITEKPKKSRVITQTSRWLDISGVEDMQTVELIGLTSLLDTQIEEGVSKMIAQQIRTKICGYASQDREKKLFSKSEFVNYQDVLELFKTSKLNCYYCKQMTRTLYEYVREPMQWTLERLDNSRGHNRDNVVLACLQCNLRRRCMASERYVKTKEMSKIVKLN